MDWFAHVDIYCERTHDGVWSEPLNFFTNAAFIASALILFFKVGKLSSTRLLCLLLAGIGVASGLFHFFGQIWSLIADILSINLFVLFYLFFSNRHYLGASPLWAALGAVMFLPYVAAKVPIFQMILMIEGSAVRIQNGEEIHVHKGDFWRSPGGIEHGVIGGPDGAVIVDVFSPPRSEYNRPGTGFAAE